MRKFKSVKVITSLTLAVALSVGLGGCSANDGSKSGENSTSQEANGNAGQEEGSSGQDAGSEGQNGGSEGQDADGGSSNADGEKYKSYAGMSAKEIVDSLSLEQKVGQMLQPACYNIDTTAVMDRDFGSILSIGELYDFEGWADFIDDFQEAALKSDAGIPYIYGQDQVHGIYGCLGGVIYPHNIGLGAANDEDLMHEIGLATADESKLCHILFSFSPCVAQSVDPRWGRTYECYGSDLSDITKLSVAFTEGLQEGGIAACTKHFFGDGNVSFGTG
ncbi:MAG: beta-N-acetylhexosaminidase, partial [Lachnospiraceae bacterium]|nr:beta-N-acetylhexosaminidase [Lachnospiraceae bacterium]